MCFLFVVFISRCYFANPCSDTNRRGYDLLYVRSFWTLAPWAPCLDSHTVFDVSLNALCRAGVPAPCRASPAMNEQRSLPPTTSNMGIAVRSVSSYSSAGVLVMETRTGSLFFSSCSWFQFQVSIRSRCSFCSSHSRRLVSLVSARTVVGSEASGAQPTMNG